MAWPPVTHQDVQDAVSALRAASVVGTITPEQYGATGDCRYFTNAAISSTVNPTVLTTPSPGPFLSTDVGKVAVVKGAGAAGGTLLTTVASYQSATQVTLSASAGTTVTNAEAAVGTDDQTALQNALNALTTNQNLLLTAGKNYLHSGVLTMSVAGSGIDGNLSGALIGSTATACALKVTANNVRVQDLVINLPGLSLRGAGLNESSSVWVSNVSGFYANRVTVQTGTFGVFTATDFEIVDVVIRNTLADGLHMTAGCRNGKVIRPTVIRPGDDGVAVISYTSDGTVCSNIEIRSPRVWGQTYGRGVTCVGGTDILYTDVQVYGSDGAGIYFAQENSTYVTFPLTRVRAQGGRLSFSNRNVGPSGDHGAVLIFGEATSGVLSGVEVSDFVIEDTRVAATENFRIVLNNGSTLSNCIADRIQFRGNGPNYDWVTAGWPSGITATNIDNVSKVYQTLRATADVTTTSTTSGQVGSFGWGISTTGTYLMELEGLYQSSATTLGPRFGVSGNVSGVGVVTASVEQNTAVGAESKTQTGWASNVGVNPGTATTSFPLRVRSFVTVTSIGSGATLQFSWQMSAAGTGTIKAGTTATLTRLA